MSCRIVPDIVSGQHLCIAPPSATAAEAARMMAERNIGAVIVAEEGRLVGIFTERDLTRHIVALGLDPRATRVGDAMTSDIATISPDDPPLEALQTMRRMGTLHLPVMDGERIVGILSIRDLYAALQGPVGPRQGAG